MKISLTELRRVIASDAERLVLRQQVADLLVESAALKKQILDLLAGDSALLAQATAAFDRSEAVEAKMRAGLPAQP